MKSDDVRASILELFYDASLNFNLLLCSRIDHANLSDDILDINAFLSVYIVKHSIGTFSIDTTTLFFQKDLFCQHLATYLSKLTPDELERLGALVCTFLGCDEAFVTKKSHDQGIDIIGIERFKLFSSTRNSYIIGQSKNYSKGLVDVRDVRELAGAILLLRHKEFSQQLVYKSISISSLSPVKGIFVTSYFFAEPALKLCDNSGIIPIDFLDLLCLIQKQSSAGRIDIITNGLFDSAKMDTILSNVVVLK